MAAEELSLARLESFAVAEPRSAVGQWLEYRAVVPLRRQVAPCASLRFVADGQLAILSFIAHNGPLPFFRHGIGGSFSRAVRQDRVLPRRERQTAFARIDASILSGEEVDAAFGPWRKIQRRKIFLVQAEAVEIQRPFIRRAAVGDFDSAENRSGLMEQLLLFIRQTDMAEEPFIPFDMDKMNRLLLAVRRLEEYLKFRAPSGLGVMAEGEFMAVCPQADGVEIRRNGKRLRGPQNERSREQMLI